MNHQKRLSYRKQLNKSNLYYYRLYYFVLCRVGWANHGQGHFVNWDNFGQLDFMIYPQIITDLLIAYISKN